MSVSVDRYSKFVSCVSVALPKRVISGTCGALCMKRDP